jgi:quinol monooxygenase YgiN
LLIIAGTLHTDPDQRDELMSRAQPMIEASRREGGCRDYTFTLDGHDPSAIRLFELWDSEEALAAHAASDHMAHWLVQSKDLVTGRSLTVYTVADQRPL